MKGIKHAQKLGRAVPQVVRAVKDVSVFVSLTV